MYSGTTGTTHTGRSGYVTGVLCLINNKFEMAFKFEIGNNKVQTIKKRRTEEEIVLRREAAKIRLEFMNGLRPIQKDVLLCLESTELSSLVIIPTGSGKTLLMSLLACKTKCSVVFAPYTLLKNQLYEALAERGATHFWPLRYESESIDMMLCNAHFILISFEAASTCASLLLALVRINRLGPIFVDEVYAHMYIYINI